MNQMTEEERKKWREEFFGSLEEKLRKAEKIFEENDNATTDS